MRTRDVIIGLTVLVVVITAVLVYKNSKNKNLQVLPNPTPNYQQIENKFPGIKVPENADRIDLSNVSGGEGMGEAFRIYQNGKFDITIMANLPDGNYSAYMADPGGTKILLGKLTLEKGGYIISYSSDKDLTSYNKIFVTSEAKNILEGSF